MLRGKYTTIINMASLIQLFLNLGIGNSYARFKRKKLSLSKNFFSTIMYLQLIIYLVLMIPIFFMTDGDGKYIIIISILCVVENQVVSISIVEDIVKKNKLFLLTNIVYLLLLVINYFFYNHNFNALMLVVIINYIIVILTLVLKFKLISFNVKLINKEKIIKLLKISIPIMLMNMLMYVNYHADVLFLKFMTNDYYSIGLYGTAVTLGNMLWIIPDAFKDIIYNRSARKDNANEIFVAILINILFCIIILIGFVVFGKLFLRIMYGQDFVNAYYLVITLFIGTIPMILYKLIHPLYISNGKVKIVVLFLLFAALINIVGNLVLIPIYGAFGAAISSVLSYALCGLAFFIKFKKDYKVSIKKIKEIFKNLKVGGLRDVR